MGKNDLREFQQDAFLLDTSLGGNPVAVGGHSHIDTRLVYLTAFFSPAHYSNKVPNIARIGVNQWSSRVTLNKTKNIYHCENLLPDTLLALNEKPS